MTTTTAETGPARTGPPRVRASDAEREEVARLVQAAGAEGRLTLGEAGDRMTEVYAARFRDELVRFTEDLPAPPRPHHRRGPARPLAVHALVVLVVAFLLLGRWVASGAEFFWPAFPLFWLGMSLVVHAARRRRRR